ncbi:MgtC/SapB family protein [Ottowia oryzae]|uniref:Protein MgtC n=1 Tax=Ottowia oryzae TaxID=2109914 RepID=A0A2S0ME00_9BURK|nr:MgtC/SapB family protein [Ottowia oryzae]AVO33953.1 methyltransferase [Ottowia oryzae]
MNLHEASSVSQALLAEFSDVHDLGQLVRILLRMVLALALGCALGYERESHGKAAGVRTHMLVAMGSALFVLLPEQLGVSAADLSRVVQGLVAGVGFLCAGTILKSGASGAEQVHGLTTAAGLWLTAAIGMACGMGLGVTALIATALAMVVFALVPRFNPASEQDKAARPEWRDTDSG